MAKRDKETITLGSGKVFFKEVTDSMPNNDDLFKNENLLGHIKGGASLSYNFEVYEEKDDLEVVQKTIVTNEEVILGLGLITWNGNTLAAMIERCKVEEDSTNGKRTIKIGGDGNSQGNKYYAIGFKHEDKKDGNVTVVIKGKNRAGVTLAFAKESGTTVNPEFKAISQDTNGTLVVIEEEIDKTTE